ncbi:MAG TPA: ABC transporter substrate-binding protein, partial [Blastocatellia bacterium]
MNPKHLLAILIIILCLFAGCGSDQKKDARDGVIPVGIVTSLTGSEARFGQAQKYGYQVALDE